MSELEEYVLDNAAKDMAKSIDFEILMGFLIEIGWHKVVLHPMTHEQGNEIDEWCAKNCSGHMETLGLVWLFENEDDANWFRLRWL